MYSSVTCSERQFELIAENSRTIRPSMIGLGRFIVGVVGSVVADLGICENDDLSGIGRIGSDFLVAG